MAAFHPPLSREPRSDLRALSPLALAILVAFAAATPEPPPSYPVRVYPERDGVTRVEVDANDPDVPYRYRQHSDVDGGPRGVLRLQGVHGPFDATAIPVRDCNLDRVRVVHHPELETPELHVVFDLVETGVTALSISRTGPTLVVLLGRRQRTATSDDAFPEALPTSPPTPTPTPSPTPAPSPSATPTAPPTPIVSRPTAAPRSPGPAPAPAAPRTLYRRDGKPGAPVPSPTTSASTITEMTVSQRADGSTLLRVTADQVIQRHAVLDFGDPRDPARHVLLFLGIRTTEIPTLLEVDGPCLRAVQVTTAALGRPAETQLGLVLTSSRVRVAEIATHGRHLVVVLAPREEVGGV